MLQAHVIAFNAYLPDIDAEAANVYPLDFKLKVIIFDDQSETPVFINDNADIVADEENDPESESAG